MSEPLQSLLHLVRRHRAGTVLFREGEPGEKMFQEAHAIVKRVLSARLAEAREEDAYTTYLSLKQRFEYA